MADEWSAEANGAGGLGRNAVPLLGCVVATFLALYAGSYSAHGPAWLNNPTDWLELILALGLGAIGIGLWAVFKRPTVGLLMLVALLYTNASEIAVRYYAMPSFLQLLSLATAAGVVIRLLPHRDRVGQRLILDPLFVPLVLYGVVLFSSSLVAANLASADQRFWEFAKSLLVFLVVTNLATSQVTLRRIVWALVLSGAFLSTISVYQVLTSSYDQDFGGFGRIKVAQIVGESIEPRIGGSIGDPNFYAQILVALVPLALYRLWDEPLLTRKLVAGYALAIITLAAIFTYSRGGAIALALVLLFALVHKRVSLKYLLIGLLAFAPLTFVVPAEFSGRLGTLTQLTATPEEGASTEGEDSSFRHRQMLMAAAREMFEDHPVLGVGAGNYADNFNEYGIRLGMTQRSFDNFGEPQFPHELYLEVAAETGIVGLIAFISIVVGTFTSLWLAYRGFAGAGSTRSANLVVSIGLAVTAFLFTSVFLHGTYLRYLWLLVAIVAAARQVSLHVTPGTVDE